MIGSWRALLFVLVLIFSQLLMVLHDTHHAVDTGDDETCLICFTGSAPGIPQSGALSQDLAVYISVFISRMQSSVLYSTPILWRQPREPPSSIITA